MNLTNEAPCFALKSILTRVCGCEIFSVWSDKLSSLMSYNFFPFISGNRPHTKASMTISIDKYDEYFGCLKKLPVWRSSECFFFRAAWAADMHRPRTVCKFAIKTDTEWKRSAWRGSPVIAVWVRLWWLLGYTRLIQSDVASGLDNSGFSGWWERFDNLGVFISLCCCPNVPWCFIQVDLLGTVLCDIVQYSLFWST